MPLLGCKVPNAGAAPRTFGLPQMARAAEDAGADSLWVPDHVVLMEQLESRYPYGEEGLAAQTDEDYYHPLMSLAWMAAATTRVELGTAVYVLPQRNAVEVAKTLATMDVLSSGRIVFGVGAGWCAEEFELLGATFKNRFSLLEEQMDVLRHLWTGTGDGYEARYHQIPQGTYCLPKPHRPGGPPLLVGGMADGPLRRAARLGDGWLAVVRGDAIDEPALRAALQSVRRYRAEADADTAFRTTVRLQAGSVVDRGALAIDWSRRLFDMGFDEVIIDPGWSSIDHAQDIIGRARDGMLQSAPQRQVGA
jgi:probable F420-dependent oxidoreductase